MKTLLFWNISAVLLLLNVTACATSAPVESPAIAGPALLLFYTDNWVPWQQFSPIVDGIEQDFRATQILTAVRQVTRGKDAFFPATNTNVKNILEMMMTAMNTEHLLDITYQKLIDIDPHLRRIEPLRLEQWKNLYYLHAYCHLAESNRVFRVDRIKDCQLVEKSAYDKRLIRD